MIVAPIAAYANIDITIPSASSPSKTTIETNDVEKNCYNILYSLYINDQNRSRIFHVRRLIEQNLTEANHHVLFFPTVSLEIVTVGNRQPSL